MSEATKVVPVRLPGLAADRDAWDRQPMERDKEWEAFRTYRDMDPMDGSVRGAYAAKSGRERIQLAQTWYNWAVKFSWKDRVRLHDEFIDQTISTALMMRRYRARHETAKVGQMLRKKASEALKALQTTIWVDARQEDGSTERVKRSALSPQQISNLASVGTKLERLALGDPTDVQMTLGVVAHFNLDQPISDEELLERAAAIVRNRQRDTGPVVDGRSSSLDQPQLLDIGSARPDNGRGEAAGPNRTSGPPAADLTLGTD